MEKNISSHILTAKGWFEQGNEHKRDGNFAAALDAFRQSIKLDGRMAAPWMGLAQLLETNSQFEDARSCLQRATLADPKNIIALSNLALIHKKLGYVDDAKAAYERALTLNPKSSAIHFGMGQLQEDLGLPDAAAKAYRMALTLDPSLGEPLANLLGLGRHVDISKEIEVAKCRLRNEDDRNQALIGYGLGKAFEQKRQYSEAFEAFAIANNARRDLSGQFDRKAFDKRIEEMMRIFSASFFKQRRGWGDPSQRPVFIVGLPRSGTTLTEQIIGSHPNCFGAGELNTLTDLATGTPDRLENAEITWPSCATDLDEEHVSALGEDYLDQSALRAPDGVQRIVDKQPLNFWHLGLIAMALPNARIIHCTRDIRDCGLSIFSHNFSLQQKWSTDLDDIAIYWHGYRKLMEHWNEVAGLEILEVSYEDTVSDVECQARRLLSFLDLPWNPNVLDFHKNDRAVQTPSRWQVRQPVYQSSKARWRHYNEQLGPLIEAANSQ